MLPPLERLPTFDDLKSEISDEIAPGERFETIAGLGRLTAELRHQRTAIFG